MKRRIQGRAEAGDIDWDAQAGVGRPRKRPDSLSADKAYGSRAGRASPRCRRVRAVILRRRDQVALHWQATNGIVETIDWTRATPDKSRS
ncbi:hypothetical protein ACOBQX_17760 [Actinokineospora sp. G85]|uniref:hypothetical protein n=1 Tax=Actinokineospora sp. G85 TaxID=3406626 RepID=UPI003C71865B